MKSGQVKQTPVPRQIKYQNLLNKEILTGYSIGEISEVEGKIFWVFYNDRGQKRLLSKESWKVIK